MCLISAGTARSSFVHPERARRADAHVVVLVLDRLGQTRHGGRSDVAERGRSGPPHVALLVRVSGGPAILRAPRLAGSRTLHDSQERRDSVRTADLAERCGRRHGHVVRLVIEEGDQRRHRLRRANRAGEAARAGARAWIGSLERGCGGARHTSVAVADRRNRLDGGKAQCRVVERDAGQRVDRCPAFDDPEAVDGLLAQRARALRPLQQLRFRDRAKRLHSFRRGGIGRTPLPLLDDRFEAGGVPELTDRLDRRTPHGIVGVRRSFDERRKRLSRFQLAQTARGGCAFGRRT